MKTASLNPKTQYLLGAGLDVLHFESSEWLETIDFWKDEIRFFDDLLKKKEGSDKSNPEYERMQKNLDKVHSDLFDDLKDSLVAHEQLLSKLDLGEKGLSDDDYRKKHQHLLSRISTFKNDFKTFKRIVFDYTKEL